MTEPTALAGALARVGERWTLLIVDALLGGPARFGDLAAAVAGIAPNILAGRLRRLEAEGLLGSLPYSERPPRREYQLRQKIVQVVQREPGWHQWRPPDGPGSPAAPGI